MDHQMTRMRKWAMRGMLTAATAFALLAAACTQNTVHQDAKRGSASAQRDLGNMYANGEGALQDYAEAARWYRLAAEQGLADAQLSRGAMYKRGEGVPHDDAEGVRWYRLAAEQGLADAQASLGASYALGSGVPRDDAEAFRWFRLAAEQGVAGAQFSLGGSYLHGEGVLQDYISAHMWLNLAATGDDELLALSARTLRDNLAAKMTREQIAEAQARAREWSPR